MATFVTIRLQPNGNSANGFLFYQFNALDVKLLHSLARDKLSVLSQEAYLIKLRSADLRHPGKRRKGLVRQQKFEPAFLLTNQRRQREISQCRRSPNSETTESARMFPGATHGQTPTQRVGCQSGKFGQDRMPRA
jgi:hypothetical protein